MNGDWEVFEIQDLGYNSLRVIGCMIYTTIRSPELLFEVVIYVLVDDLKLP